MSQEITRRDMIRVAATGAVLAPVLSSCATTPPRTYPKRFGKIPGANDRIQIGIVGPGGRGSNLIDDCQRFQDKHNAELVAVCDLWRQRRESVAAKLAEETGAKPKVYASLAEICQDPSIDALIIATPDFAHAPHCRQAVLAGKDVYVEKPLGCDFDQLRLCWEAVKSSDRVVQVGTQRRGEAKFYGCRDFVLNGFLGKVSYGEISEPLWQPRWRIRGSETSLTEADTDWRAWQDYAYDPARPFDARVYREFRLFWPFSTGCFCQWMSHQIDIVNLVLDEWPESVTANGGVYVWKDGRVNGDTVQAAVTYPSGCMVTYHMRMGNSANGRGTTLYGTCGTLEVDRARAHGGGGRAALSWDKDPETGIPRWHADESQRVPEAGIDLPRNEAYPNVEIMDDWLGCIRSRQPTRAHIDAGFSHALATTMAGMSYRTGRRVVFDRETMSVRFG